MRNIPYKFLWFLIIIFLIIIFVYRYIVHPSTTNAYVWGKITPIATEIGGKIIDIPIENHQIVKAGALLLQLDPRAYQLALINAQTQLQQAQYQKTFTEDNVKVLQEQLKQAQIRFKLAGDNDARIEKLSKQGFSSAQATEISRSNFELARSQSTQLQLQINALQSKLAANGEIALAIQSARNKVDQAQYQLSLTTVRSPFEGQVTLVTQTPGTSVKEDQVLFALIKQKDIWVQANFEETDLKYIHVKDKVAVQLNTNPHDTLEGYVSSISPGIARNDMDANTGLLQTQPENNWVNLPQRIPVLITLTHLPKDFYPILGSTADVKVIGR